MKKIARFIRHHFVKIIVGLAALGLIATAILRLITPQEPDIKQAEFETASYNQQSVEFKQLSYAGSEVNIPRQLNVYQLQYLPNFFDNLVSNLVTQNQLKSVREGKIWASKEYSLNLSGQENSTIATLVVNTPPPVTEPISEQRAQQIALQFFEDFFPQQIAVNPLPAETKYFTGNYELTPVEPQEATTVQLYFNILPTTYPVYIQNQQTSPLFITVRSGFGVSKFVFHDIFYKVVDSQPKTTLSINQVLENINLNNKGAVIDVSELEAGSVNVQQIESGLFDQASVEYRLDPQQQIAYPFVRFVGRVNTAGKQDVPLMVVSPLVNTTSPAQL